MFIEEALELTNEHGIMQTMSIILLSLFSIICGMQIAASNYISERLDHWCTVPALQHLDYDTQKRLAIPYDGENYDSCTAYKVEWSNYTEEDFLRWNGSRADPSTPTESCSSWTYYKGDMDNTAVSEWNLVCNNDTMPELMSSLFMLGMLVGSFISNLVSERLGRSLSTFIFGILLTAVSYAAAFTPEPISFGVFRFTMGLTVRVCALAVSVHAIEIAGKGQRELAGVLSPSAVAVGMLLCAFSGYFLRDFQPLMLVMAVAQTSLLALFLIVPESPRWLMISGRKEKAEKVVKWIGEVNRSPLPEDFSIEVKGTGTAKSSESRDNLSFIDLLRNPVVRKNVLLMHYFVIASHFSYMTMTLNLGSLTGSIHMNVFLSGILELPATIFALIILKFAPRVKTVILFGVVFTVANIIAIIFELIPDLGIVATVFTIIARAAASGQVSVLRIIITELFPTAVRQRAVGSVTALSSILSLFGPFIGEPLRRVWPPLPNILFGTLGLLGVLLSFCLPETRGIPLPDTIEEAAQLSKKIQREHAKNAKNGIKPNSSQESREKPADTLNEKPVKFDGNLNEAFVNVNDLEKNTKF